MVSVFFFFKQKTAYEMRISDWSSDVCSSDLGTLELRDGAEHVKGEHATRRCRVDALGQRHQPDLLALQILGRGDTLLERAGEAVELPNNQRVACAQNAFQNARQFGPFIARARRLFGEHSLAAGPPQRIELELGVLVAGAEPGIADPHERLIFSKLVRGIPFCDAGFQTSFDKVRPAAVRCRPSKSMR